MTTDERRRELAVCSKTSVNVHDFHAGDLLTSAAWTRHQL